MRGRTLHRGLRSTEVSVSAQDLEHGKCIVCGKWLPSGSSEHRRYCSSKCVAKLKRTINPGPGWRRKVTDKQLAEIHAMRKQGMIHRKIAERIGISPKSVENILNGHLRK